MNELDALLEQVSGYFAVLSEPTRLKIIRALCDGEKSVNDIVEQVESTQSNVSRHLNLMYRAGVLGRRKEGTLVMYTARSMSPASTSAKPKSAAPNTRAMSSSVVTLRWPAVGASLTAVILTLVESVADSA